MGARKRLKAEQLKETKSKIAIAKLNNCPISARKMRLVADIVRGVEVNKALNILSHNSKEASLRLEKLLRSAIANWEQKNEDKNLEDETLIVSEIRVDNIVNETVKKGDIFSFPIDAKIRPSDKLYKLIEPVK
jgi:large subunit ribosomal protein L22